MPIKPRSPQSVQIIGHRGSAAPFPENTLEAILYGIISGARMIEVDLRLSKDQEVILSHDENLSKIFASRGKIPCILITHLIACPGDSLPLSEESEGDTTWTIM